MDHAPEQTPPDRPLELYDQLVTALRRLAGDVDQAGSGSLRRRTRLALRAAVELGEQLGWAAHDEAPARREPFRPATTNLHQPPSP